MASTAPGPPNQVRAQLDPIYDLYRSARLNQLYYGCKLSQYQSANTLLELAVAVGTSGTIAAYLFTLWPELWGGLAIGAAIAAVAAPALRLSKRIEQYSRLFAGYASLFCELRRLTEEIRVEEGVPPAVVKAYDRAYQRACQLAIEDDPKPSNRLIAKYTKAVNTTIPPDRLWYP